jgi:hypothetical protein
MFRAHDLEIVWHRRADFDRDSGLLYAKFPARVSLISIGIALNLPRPRSVAVDYHAAAEVDLDLAGEREVGKERERERERERCGGRECLGGELEL